MIYRLETKPSRSAKWRPIKFMQVLANKDAAVALARDYDEHGLVVRVMEAGHTDGMDRTIYTNLSSSR